MTASGSKSTKLLGYLTFVSIPNHGIVGGYLLVNQRARPVEFHCTAPVLTNRTQEILYGCTFRTTLLCDQIGQALLGQASQLPNLMLTDESDAVGLRQLNNIPLALFVDEKHAIEGARDCWSFEFASCTVTTAPGFDTDREQVRDVLREVDPGWDLTEPLERIRAAINEAQRAAA